MALDQDQFRAIVSGRRRDAWARAARSALWVASLDYRLVVGIRNRLYDWGLLRSHRASVPVICVGNLTTGGTGKTPLVAWLARFVAEKGLRPAILTRGYKAHHCPGEAGNAHPTTDEPAELAQGCPGVPVIVNGDRVAGAAEAVRNHDAQVLLMDDGFQHRRLGRDLDIVTIDATVPFGYGRLLPAGFLREPIGSLKRAGAVVVTRSNQVSEDALKQIESRIHQVRPDIAVARSVHAPVGARPSEGPDIGLEALQGKKVFAFCGLGNPKAFFATVQACGCLLAGSQAFNDHHTYADDDLAELHEMACSKGVDLLLTTQKDWTKIAFLPRPKDAVPMAYLAIALQFTAGQDALSALLDRTLAGTIPPS